MPIYDFQCEPCSYGEEAYVAKIGGTIPCPTCKVDMERVWSLGTARNGTQIFPYVTKHLTGKPIEIKSKSHLRELERIHGVRLRDDTSYVNQEYHGLDFRTGKQIYSEGSGRGMKGQWV